MAVSFIADVSISSCEFTCTFGTFQTLVPDPYTGSYDVTPKANEIQTLQTRYKNMLDNVTVQKVPYYETSNPQDGLTAYIAQEVN